MRLNLRVVFEILAMGVSDPSRLNALPTFDDRNWAASGIPKLGSGTIGCRSWTWGLPSDLPMFPCGILEYHEKSKGPF